MNKIANIVDSNESLKGRVTYVDASTQNAHFENILRKIKSQPAGDLLPVVNVFQSSAQILKYNNITFHEGAILEFSKLSHPWVALVAKKLRFNAPQQRSSIRRALMDSNKLNGKPGKSGENGKGYTNAPNGIGRHGESGKPGGAGESGRFRAVPDLYIFVEEIVADFGNPAVIDLVVEFCGIRGGNGGAGGQGGHGGAGERGTHSKSRFFCHAGPGPGGNGGNGAPGGHGGNGANGSDGADIFLISPMPAQERMAYFKYFNSEGGAGARGSGGAPGRGAPPGMEGQATFLCGPRRDGKRGFHGGPPNPRHLGHGKAGKKGKRGNYIMMERSIADLF